MEKESNGSDVEMVSQKRYLVLADELHRALLGRLMPGLMFTEVEGIRIKESDGYAVLVNPLNEDLSKNVEGT